MVIHIKESELERIVSRIVTQVLQECFDKQEIIVEHMKGSAKYEPKNGGTWKEYWEKNQSESFLPREPSAYVAVG